MNIYVTFISVEGGREEMHIETLKSSLQSNLPGKCGPIYVTFISLGREGKCTSMKTVKFSFHGQIFLANVGQLLLPENTLNMKGRTLGKAG